MYAVRLTLPIAQDVGVGDLSNLAAAIDALAALAEQKWMAYAQGLPLPNGATITPRTGSYLRSIKRESTGVYGQRVFSDAPHAEAIERGTGPRDLHRLLDTSLKVRTTKDGRRYLIIPFRWGTGTGSGRGVSFGRQIMPPSVHALARQLAPSRITGTGQRPSGTGALDVKTRQPLTVAQRRYRWGGRLSVHAIASVTPSAEHARRMAGMVRMNGGKHSEYLTFRALVEGGKGWIVPAQAGKYPARTVAQEIEKIAPDILRRALEADVAGMV